MKANILAVDDEKDMTRLLQRTLESEIDCRVSRAFSAKMAMTMIEQQNFDLVISDIRMPDIDGFELLEYIKTRHPDLTVVMLTAFGNIESAVKAVKKGAYDFIPKPFEHDEIIYKINKALERSFLLDELKKLKGKTPGAFGNLIGQSKKMLAVFDKISLFSESDITVLVTGESGTGKDLTAKSIHEMSSRKTKPFIAVNCPTIPEHILESELFGYKKGAFTNAARDRNGLFHEADKGTIFLDEIGDIGPGIQTKLLRVVQEKEIKPLGDARARKVDVRIIASTNRNLKKKIADNEFREDFFYRLNVLSIELPPLRDRITDIPLLAEHLVSKHCGKLRKKPKMISENALDLLMRHSWPGNVRELENVLLQGIIYSRDNIISEKDIPLTKKVEKAHAPERSKHYNVENLSYKNAKEKSLIDFNHYYIGAMLSMTNGNITQAARKCGLERQALQQIIKRFSINPDNFRT